MEFSEKKVSVFRAPWAQSVIAVVLIFGSLGGMIFWQKMSTTVLIDMSVLEAPIAHIAPSSGGVLNALYVKEGDYVVANTAIAQVGTETLFAKEEGIVISKPQVLGTYVTPGQKIVDIVSNNQMRVVGTLEETEGLAKIQPGQAVTFTVDAYMDKVYEGSIDSISPVSNDAGVAFAISDKRPVKKFNVYARFDASQYPELKSGMSAKMTVYLK
ncbi:MAG TPA: efflux RND transporter periplasmic adaptor subunit [Candidatus Paceibacterota bacterium]|nr:efflux RND transporter periplasmic adaptor subunit [Candidatus Paceibacterota bacterium]